MEQLQKALLDGDQDRAVAEVVRLLEAGTQAERIMTDAIEVAMERLGAKCTCEQFNLLEIMLVGRAVRAVMQQLFPESSPPPRKGNAVIASLEGDVHDLGKNIFKTVLATKGVAVTDCGKDCPIERLLDAAEREATTFICISGLITSIIPKVRQVRELALQRGLRQVKIIAGGAALKQSTAKSLNVDYVAENAFDGVRYVEQVLEAKA